MGFINDPSNSVSAFVIASSSGKVSTTHNLTASTGNESAFVINYTTNKATSGNDTGLVINQTDTASPGTSLLLDAQVGGTSKFSVDNAGLVNFTGTDGSGAGAGTITDAPSAGNPNNWIPVSFNGTTHYIPAWT